MEKEKSQINEHKTHCIQFPGLLFGVNEKLLTQHISGARARIRARIRARARAKIRVGLVIS